jgi:signal transduction histidine kinase
MQTIPLCQFSPGALGLVDAPPEPAFDNITALAASIFAAPSAVVSIVEPERDRQYFKSQRGVPEPWASMRQTPLSHSFCNHVVRLRGPLVVENAPEHPLVRGNPGIAALGITAYLGVPINDPAGHPVGALCVVDRKPRRWTEADVTTLAQLAACVSDAIHLKAEIMAGEALRAEQQEFTYALSHELKGPTNTLHLLLNEMAALRSSRPSPECDELLGLGLETISRMGGMIEDVLAYTQVIGRKLEFEKIDLGRLVREILDDLKADIARTGAVVGVADLPTCDGNLMQLRMLLQNLVANALKFRKKDVAPAVSVTGEVIANGDQIRLTVKDNGIGIAPEDHRKIFKLFRRLHLREEYAGTGLGLALCKRIVSNHGGEISVSSHLGEGSEFTVLLPRTLE